MQFIEVIIVNYLIIGGWKHPVQMCTEWNCNHMKSHGNNVWRIALVRVRASDQGGPARIRLLRIQERIWKGDARQVRASKG